MRPASIHIEVHETIACLEAEWRDLEARGHATPFQCYDFIAPLYAAFVAFGAARPLAVVVRNAPAAPPIMILPLCEREEAGLRLIEFADIRVADYCAPVVADVDWSQPAAMRALWRAIERRLPASDAIRLRKLPARVGTIANPLLLLRPIHDYHVKAHGIAIAAPWREKATAIVRKRTRDRLRRAEASLSALGALTFRTEAGSAAASELYEVMLRQRTSRFARLGRDDIMAKPMWQVFFRDLTEGRTTRRPCARVMALHLDDRPVATALGFVRDDTFFLVILAFEMEAYDRYSPGKLMLHRAMERFAEDGLCYFDFTVGDEPYKRDFSADDRTLRMVVRGRSPRGLAHCALWEAKQVMRRYPRARGFLKRCLARG